ncbi:MAG: CpaF family protein [Lachnospiraceae bacterium]|jgi:pilus assembly protein CpaF|nr:CpaF family protein [Lachnospiraceae bacterium]
MIVNRYTQIREEIHDAVMRGIDFSRSVEDGEVLELIDDEIVRAKREGSLSLDEMKRMRQELFNAIRRLDILQDLIEDPTVTEIMINGPDRIFVERDGKVRRTDLTFVSKEKLEDVVRQIVSACNRVVNESSPIVDARLDNGDRVNVVLPPVALNGPIVTIRRFPDKPILMEDLLAFGSVSEEIASFLDCIVRAGYNIFISGGTGSGKTTFLNALSEYIPADERVITIEDNAELQIRHIDNLVRLEARNANVEGCRPISIRDLIRSALRMRPDRIIVGEVRGSEAIDMIQAMNTGHDGSLSTGHANSARDMLARLETMVLMAMDLPLPAIRGQIASAIDLIIHLGRLRDRSRKLLEICEVTGLENGCITTAPVYRFYETGEKDGKIIGGWEQTGQLRSRDKLMMAGVECHWG